MAFRIHASVVRGEIDNRVKGVVRGRIWLAEKKDPLILNLKGNAWPDLAGCVVTFTNRLAPETDRQCDVISAYQTGIIGDITASRKVRVFDIPVAEAYAMCKRGEKPPEHMANSIYVEWFSNANGRVVIESTDYDIHISEPEWRMTPEEDRERAEQAALGLANFMSRLSDAVDRHRKNQKDPEEPWDEHDYEKFLKESDARTDKLMELQDIFGNTPEAQENIDAAMGWTKANEAADDDKPSFIVEDLTEDDLEPSPPDPAREGIDWIRDEYGDICHPLQHRCSNYAFYYLELVREDATSAKNPAIQDFVFKFQTTAAKLAGALNSVADGCPVDPAFTVALLKRALNHLHASQAALEIVAAANCVPEATVSRARAELFEIRQQILDLMTTLRRKQ